MSMYIPRGGEQTFAPPFLQKDTRLQGFVLDADPAALQRLCDRYLNAPMGRQVYRPLMSKVLLAFAPIGSTQSTDPPDHDKGYTPETDIAFWLLAGAMSPSGSLERLAWFLPYVWVDVPTTMATGREVYGYPKEVGWLDLPGQAGDPLVFGLSTLVLPTYSPQTELIQKPVLRVERAESGGGAAGRAWRDLEDAFGDLRHLFDDHLAGGLLADLELIEYLIKLLLERKVPMVFLKQFRDLIDPQRACYQAVIESPARVEGLPRGGLLPGEHRVSIRDWASHPIAADLGLGTPRDGLLELTARLAFHVEFDFRVELGEVIWQSP